MTTDDNFSDVLNDEDIGNGCSALADEISPEAVRICVIATGLPAKMRELTQMVEGFQMEGKRLRAELEAARRDAERYRWLRNACLRDTTNDSEWSIWHNGSALGLLELSSLYEAIDAAIAKERSSHEL